MKIKFGELWLCSTLRECNLAAIKSVVKWKQVISYEPRNKAVTET